MAQTADALSAVNTLVEISADGATWANVSGSSNSIEPGEQTRMSGVAYTFVGDTAIVLPGKREPLELVGKHLYTSTNGEAYEVVRAIHESNGVGFVRYSPEGGATGDSLLTSDRGVFTGFTYPKGDASDANPVMGGWKFKTGKLTTSTIPAP
jgi:hypothetical protein